MDVPQTQNTAPVLEFRCLYTQDLRRKQKRWQDGRLKFHTFNKRAMVYDERSNFVGDTHWREDTAFDEGEKLELERGGILVEVGECVGKRDQDLFELVDKRVKEREERAAAKIAASSPSRPHASLIRTTQGTPAMAGPLQHKPLNTMLAPTGHYGRALLHNTSPFEEKQRLMNGNRDGAENGRPAKRRKQNDDAPSKSGYAQNLMGATLTLTSSRPPSTATICYEPVRARPSKREILAPTIDITAKEDEEERDTGSRRVSVMEERTPGERRGKGQRRLKRSPARNGYASSLTRASLTLSRPETLSSSRINVVLPAIKLAKPILQEGDDSSQSDEESFIDIDSVASKLLTNPPKESDRKRKAIKSPKRNPASSLPSSSPTLADDPIPISKTPRDSTRKKAKSTKEVPAFEDQSSPTMVDIPPPKTKPTKTVQKPPIQNSSVTGATLEQPVSALRIKARPPRKMMMLMDRPSSRSSVTVEPSSANRQKPNPQISSLASNKVVLSQATIRLNSFCQKQEEIIQARLNGKRSNLDFEDSISSPEDSGIDHQTIDLLLSRNSLPMENKQTDRPIQMKPTGQKFEPTAQFERLCPANDLNNGDLLKSQSKKTSSCVLESAVIGPRDDEQSRPEDQNSLPGSTINGERDDSTSSHDSAIESGNIAASPRVTPTGGPASETTAAPPTISSEGKKEGTLPKVSQKSPMPELPEHFTSAIQAATEHFRAIIKSSASLTVQLADVSSSPLETDHVEHASSVLLHRQKGQLASCEVAVKSSPRPSPVEPLLNTASELSQVGPGSNPATGLNRLCGKADALVLAAKNGTLAAPKARLVNPATRGKSLQTIAANTVDSLAPVFSLMPPPPPTPRIITRLQRNLDRNIVVGERAALGGYMGKRTIAGPWSRESFDLFGSWLPPGTGAGGVANAAQANI